MTLQELQKAMMAAMKAHDMERKNSISLLVAAVKKVGIDAGYRQDVPEDMVDAAILKEIKAAKDQVDTCPAERAELLEGYKRNLAVMQEFAPKQLSAEEIKATITEKFGDVLASGNKGLIMKTVMAELKGKADGKLISQVVAQLTAK